MKKLIPALLLPLALLATSQPTFAQRAAPTSAAARTVSGLVTDAEGPLPGVMVLLKGTTRGTRTDATGHYTLPGVPTHRAILVFSYVGYFTREVAAPAPGAPLHVVLRQDYQQLVK